MYISAESVTVFAIRLKADSNWHFEFLIIEEMNELIRKLGKYDLFYGILRYFSQTDSLCM